MLDNVRRTVKDELATTIAKGDRLSIAAACFSIYAYQALKKQLDGIDELRLFLRHRLFCKKKLPKKNESFIYLALTTSVHAMAQNLMSNFATS